MKQPPEKKKKMPEKFPEKVQVNAKGIIEDIKGKREKKGDKKK